MDQQSKRRTVPVITGFQKSQTEKKLFILSRTLVFDEEGRLIDVKPRPQETLEVIRLGEGR
jgi:hypothetical protein